MRENSRSFTHNASAICMCRSSEHCVLYISHLNVALHGSTKHLAAKAALPTRYHCTRHCGPGCDTLHLHRAVNVSSHAMQACLGVAFTTNVTTSDRASSDQQHDYQDEGHVPRQSVGHVVAGSKLRTLAQARVDDHLKATPTTTQRS